MVVSKAPRATPAAEARPGHGKLIASLPDQHAMEAFAAAYGGASGHGERNAPRRPRGGDDPTARAQQVIYDAWEQRTKRSRLAFARKALRLSPLCADAYVILAEEAAGSEEERRDVFTRGVAAGELALGPDELEACAGSFWGVLDTRPYMRARAGLAGALLRLGDREGAVGHWRAMLKLNPNDNQGVRYLLTAELLRRGDMRALKRLLAAYKDEWSVVWLYTRALLAFREGQGGTAGTAVLVEDAREANPHVPDILSGAEPPVASRDGYVTLGGADEATWYVEEHGPAWHATPDAVTWLAATRGDAAGDTKRS